MADQDVTQDLKIDDQLQKIVLQEGNGTDYPGKGSPIEMHYSGYLYEAGQKNGMGKKFDSSYDRRSPLGSPIGVGRLIPGWDIGVPQMSLGEKAILNIPSELGYGGQAIANLIPANSRLIFQVHLVAIGAKRVPDYPANN